MSLRTWISIITFTLVGIIIAFSYEHLVQAWQLLSQVNIWILLLIIPVNILSYIAAGEMIFSYLRAKGAIKHISVPLLVRMSLELNFVNHVLPSGGVSGISYMSWRLNKLGISTGKATMAQAVRFAAGYAAFITLLAISVLLVTIDGDINRWIILISCTLVTVMVSATVGVIYLVKSNKRIERFSKKFSSITNRLVRRITRRKANKLLDEEKMLEFFKDMHDDYLELEKDRKVLIKPYLWGLFFTVMEIALFFITFLALGKVVNPAPILIAYGVASLAGFIVLTPGGTGAYEALMVFILSLAGVSQGGAIAGIVLARVLILIVTIGVGYVFYQLTIMKYGKKPNTST